MGEKRGTCKVLVGKSEINIPLGRIRLRGDCNIIPSRNGIGGVDHIYLAQDTEMQRSFLLTSTNCPIT